MFSNNDKDSDLRRKFSQTELASYSQPSSSKSKKLKTQRPYSEPSADDDSEIRDSFVPPSLVPNYQEAASSSDEAEHDDIGKSPCMIKPPLGK